MSDQVRALGSAGHELWAAGLGRQVDAVKTLFDGTRRRPLPARPARSPVVRSDELIDLQHRHESRRQPAGPWERAAVAAVWEAVRTRRVSPSDRYVAHRAYPAPRGIFAADAVLIVEDENGVTELGFSPGSGNAPSVPGSRWRRATVQLDVDELRYPEAYGSLRPALSLLEAGHLAATIAASAHRAGLTAKLSFAPPERARASSTGLSIELSRGRADDPVRDACMAEAGGPTSVALKDWFDLRSSGRSDENLVTSRPVPDVGADAVARALVAGISSLDDVVPSGAIRIFEHRVQNADLAEVFAAEITGAAERPGAPRILASRPRSTATHGLTFAVDSRAFAAVHGERTARVIPLVLGWIAQWGCLAAASNGIVARPARNYEELEWAIALRLPPESTIGYQLWLRPAPDEPFGPPWSALGVVV